jgi:hypothetical protein
VDDNGKVTSKRHWNCVSKLLQERARVQVCPYDLKMVLTSYEKALFAGRMVFAFLH